MTFSPNQGNSPNKKSFYGNEHKTRSGIPLPRKPENCFLLYAHQYCKKEGGPDIVYSFDKKPLYRELMKKAQELYKNLSEEEKQPYKDEANRLQEKYERDL